MSWEVYIIKTESGKLYTGITNNLEKRFSSHQKKSGAKFFRISSPEKIVFREKFENRSLATKREIEIKKLSRKEKLLLISKTYADFEIPTE